MSSSPQAHFLVVTFPAQGHINPGLQFAKRLVQHGVHVTFATSVSANRRMSNLSNHHQHLKFAAFSDGYDNGFNAKHDKVEDYMSEIRRCGTLNLRELIGRYEEEGRPVTCLVYTLLLPWAAQVAHTANIPSALLWIQPAAVLNIYYYYFNGYGDTINRICNARGGGGGLIIKFPGVSSVGFGTRDLPSFFLPTNPKEYAFILSNFKEQLDELDKEVNPIILVNTFDALEPEALTGIQKYKLMGVGPLLPSAFLGAKHLSDTSFGGDLFQGTKVDYKRWLDSKGEASVIYISFGSIAVISKKQAEEVGRGLLNTAKPFLWVIRTKQEGEEEEEKLSCMEELEELGMIVPWCCQVEVLSHPSIGCFMTHCGWNSTLESLVLGVPVVAFPQWTDQGTNAKLIQDLWGTGVRVTPNQDGIVEADEIKRCLEMVIMGDNGEMMRINALSWKHSAREATKQGGSADANFKAFIDHVILPINATTNLPTTP